MGFALWAVAGTGCGDDSAPGGPPDGSSMRSDGGVDPDGGRGGDGAVPPAPPPPPGDGAVPPPPPPPADGGVPDVFCDAPAFPEGTGLRRWPYLQSVTHTSARVAWTTTTGGRGAVRFGRRGGSGWTTVEATAEAFPRARTDDSTDYTAHDATLGGLEPGVEYCYEVTEDGAVLATGLSFTSAWTDGTRPLRILAFGDSGTGGRDQLALRDQMLGREFDVFLHLGDMAYDSGRFAEFEDNVFGVYRDLLHHVPTWPAIGNHEYMTDDGQPYVDVYYLLEQAMRPADQERYYSFDYGDVHFVSLDSNPEMLGTVSSSATDDMMDWAAADLSRSTAPWKIVFFHHPPYSSGDHGSSRSVQRTILPTLQDNGVDLVLVGHDHHYERTVPIFDGAEASGDARAIVYIVAGAGGAGLRSAGGDWFTDTVNDSIHSYLSFTIEGCLGHGEAIARDGSTIDRFELDGCER